ncbi:MAG: hypothetical protein HYU88_13020 [Chloroflexi bacterium]|nr:hypothetical protein [Chloroflexota bacterium]
MAILTVIAVLVAIGIYVVLRVRAGEPLGWSFRTAIILYFYLATAVSVLVMAAGLASALKAGLSNVYGREFSYAIPALEPFGRPAAERPPAPEEQERERQRQLQWVEREYQNDLFQGPTMAIVGALLWLVHTLARRAVAQDGHGWSGFLGKTYLAAMLIVFGVVGVISLPLGIAGVLRFLATQPSALVPRQPPGDAVAAALVFVPLWLVFLAAALRQVRRERVTSV